MASEASSSRSLVSALGIHSESAVDIMKKQKTAWLALWEQETSPHHGPALTAAITARIKALAENTPSPLQGTISVTAPLDVSTAPLQFRPYFTKKYSDEGVRTLLTPASFCQPTGEISWIGIAIIINDKERSISLCLLKPEQLDLSAIITHIEGSVSAACKNYTLTTIIETYEAEPGSYAALQLISALTSKVGDREPSLGKGEGLARSLFIEVQAHEENFLSTLTSESALASSRP